MRFNVTCLAAAAMAILVTSGSGPAVAAICTAGTLKGSAALNSGWSEDRPGLCRLIKLSDLPKPSSSTKSQATIIPRPTGVLPKVPPGFTDLTGDV